MHQINNTNLYGADRHLTIETFHHLYITFAKTIQLNWASYKIYKNNRCKQWRQSSTNANQINEWLKNIPNCHIKCRANNWWNVCSNMRDPNKTNQTNAENMHYTNVTNEKWKQVNEQTYWQNELRCEGQYYTIQYKHCKLMNNASRKTKQV